MAQAHKGIGVVLFIMGIVTGRLMSEGYIGIGVLLILAGLLTWALVYDIEIPLE